MTKFSEGVTFAAAILCVPGLLQYTKSGLISILRLSMNLVSPVADIGTVEPGHHRTMRQYGECQLAWFRWGGGLGDLVGGNGLLVWAFLDLACPFLVMSA
jgi:hypothetical protein